MNMVKQKNLNSGIYIGRVSHCRFTPKRHQFNYDMGLMALDLDELPKLFTQSFLFKAKNALLTFKANDYLTSLDKQFPDARAPTHTDNVQALKLRTLFAINQLGGDKTVNRVMFCGQIRHLGFYFSPVNFFFCYHDDKPLYMLAEVSNTPWNERHCYLVDLTLDQCNEPMQSDKVFHVSPFMNLDMQYIWQITCPADLMKVAITNKNQQQQTLFNASLVLKRHEFSPKGVRGFAFKHPVMTAKIVLGIYWQALKIWLKRIPYVPKPSHS